MAGFNDVLKSLGYAAGVVTGGPSQVKAVAGAAAARSKISSYLDSFGQKIGGIVGPDLFRKIAAGAQVTGDAETKSFVETKVLATPSVQTFFGISSVIVLLALGYFVYKGKS